VPFAFEILHAYQKDLDFSDGVCTLTRGIPGGSCFLADQLNRTASSVATTLALGKSLAEQA